jgi:competence protein ComEA
MNTLSALRHALGFTENEIRVVLFLSVTLLVGTGLRWIRSGEGSPPAPPSFDYAQSDSEFAARSAAPESPAGDSPSALPRLPPLTPHGIDINTASAAEFDRLPGIGPAYAERIVLDRDANGPFDGVDDLVRVKGIGPKKLEKIRPFVRAGGTH